MSNVEETFEARITLWKDAFVYATDCFSLFLRLEFFLHRLFPRSATRLRHDAEEVLEALCCVDPNL